MRPTTDPSAAPSGPATALARSAATTLPGTAERLRPWLAACAGIAIATLVSVSIFNDLTPVETASLLGPLGVVLAITALVAAPRGPGDEGDQAGGTGPPGARPAGRPPDRHGAEHPRRTDLPGRRGGLDGRPGGAGCSRHRGHARRRPPGRAGQRGEDTDALRSLLQASTERGLSLNETATLHSVCTLWETTRSGSSSWPPTSTPPGTAAGAPAPWSSGSCDTARGGRPEVVLPYRT